MKLPTVKQLKYLCALDEHRHFGHAAQACFVSQSALSTAINELEQNLGVTLFERGSVILLTPVGATLVDEAREILNQLDNFVEHAKQAQGAFASDLRFGVIPTIAPFLLPKILRPMRQLYGSNKLYIREDLSPNLLDRLGKGELDVLLFALPYETGQFHTEHLFCDELVLCLPANHLLTEKPSINLKDLKQQDILLLEDGHCLRDQSLKACNLEAQSVRIPYQATSLNTLVQMVVNRVGITLLPEMAVTANITHDTDAQIRHISTNKDVSRRIALVWRKNSPRADEYLKLAEMIREFGPPRRR
ncbi:LysR family transcriptional regulator [Arenicella chitinivorans]|uniref:LysR family transcriptional regulator n=1 Tax=Arenicella chitinivorans TaxID=1329800 RepID=A0A918RZ28_9GAMM|nr:hydrogen peroxide-inducible genes activator [Arenicella chitinivorans]GHA16872.1 LysR family transcriptional regulator [Arenicella chitinivorans]